MGRGLISVPVGKKTTVRSISRRLLGRIKQSISQQFDHSEYSSSSEAVDIRKLISPLRYDVLVRMDFFNFLASEKHLRDNDPERFMRFARQQPYYVWFKEVSCARFRPHLLKSTEKLTAAFSEKVSRCVDLYESFQAHGFIPRHAITLRSGRQVLRSDSGKSVLQTVFVADGCHRLSLLLFHGVGHLQPDWYRIRTVPRYMPLDNTRLLLPHLELTEEKYVRFVSRSFDVECSAIKDLVLHVSNNAPERLDEMKGILALDLPYIAAVEDNYAIALGSLSKGIT